MNHTIKKMLKTLACLTMLMLIQGFTMQQPAKPKMPKQEANPSPKQEEKLTPEQEKISALHKKLSRIAQISKTKAQPTENKQIANLPTLIANLKSRLQTFKTQTVTVSQQRLGVVKLIDTYTFSKNQDAQNAITATTAKNPKQKLAVSAEFTQLLQSFLQDDSFIGKLLEIKDLPMANKDTVAQRLQIKPKSEFKNLLGFSRGTVRFDSKGNLVSIELLTNKHGVQIYEFLNETPRTNK